VLVCLYEYVFTLCVFMYFFSFLFIFYFLLVCMCLCASSTIFIIIIRKDCVSYSSYYPRPDLNTNLLHSKMWFYPTSRVATFSTFKSGHPSFPPLLPLFLPLPSLPLPSLPLYSLTLPSPTLLSPTLPPLKSSYSGSGEHCKLPQWGLGCSPSWNRIWCILAVKYDIWWQQFGTHHNAPFSRIARKR